MSASGLSRVLIVGRGKMGGALLKGLSRSFDSHQVVVVDPVAGAGADHADSSAVTHCDSLSRVPSSFVPDLVVFAVKPQSMAEVVPAYSVYAASAVFLSIAAGMTLARIEGMLGRRSSCAVVRSMPNLPASIGQGMTVAVANGSVAHAQRELCSIVLGGCGEVAWVEDESLIDAVTALSGSGPAYVFALVEAMAKAGAALGLREDLAQRLARQTIIGSGALLAQSSESAEALRRAVTSKGGTTEAALAQLLAADGGLPELMRRAMTAAAERAKELAKG